MKLFDVSPVEFAGWTKNISCLLTLSKNSKQEDQQPVFVAAQNRKLKVWWFACRQNILGIVITNRIMFAHISACSNFLMICWSCSKLFSLIWPLCLCCILFHVAVLQFNFVFCGRVVTSFFLIDKFNCTVWLLFSFSYPFCTFHTICLTQQHQGRYVLTVTGSHDIYSSCYRVRRCLFSVFLAHSRSRNEVWQFSNRCSLEYRTIQTPCFMCKFVWARANNGTKRLWAGFYLKSPWQSVLWGPGNFSVIMSFVAKCGRVQCSHTACCRLHC